VNHILFAEDACVSKKSFLYKVGRDCFMWRFCARISAIGCSYSLRHNQTGLHGLSLFRSNLETL